MNKRANSLTTTLLAPRALQNSTRARATIIKSSRQGVCCVSIHSVAAPVAVVASNKRQASRPFGRWLFEAWFIIMRDYALFVTWLQLSLSSAPMRCRFQTRTWKKRVRFSEPPLRFFPRRQRDLLMFGEKMWREKANIADITPFLFVLLCR